jgi:hypothetical protein
LHYACSWPQLQACTHINGPDLSSRLLQNGTSSGGPPSHSERRQPRLRVLSSAGSGRVLDRGRAARSGHWTRS